MNRVLRVPVVLVGAFAALYLVFLLVSSLVLDVLAWTTPIRDVSGMERHLALVVSGIGSIAFSVRYAWGRGSLERLWTFVLALHFLTYLLVLPYFHFVDAREYYVSIHPDPMSSVAYYATGYGLFLLAFAVAYVLVYRDGYEVATEWLAI